MHPALRPDDGSDDAAVGIASASEPEPGTPRDPTATAVASPDVIAAVLLEGFNRHYALFRECARAAKRHFEAGNWLAIGHVARDRIDFYDRRVAETVARIEREFRFAQTDTGGADAFWAEVKRCFIGLIVDHRQPECAETFFNTVSSKLLHRTYFHNRCLFVRPSASTEYLDDGAPSYRC
jgi:isocitrate dehydrogenase kinase/phosphatase